MITPEVVLRLLLAILLGGIIGFEREYQNKSAGLRTMMLIALGSTLFTIISIHIAGTSSPDRIASNIVTGIGFVGAGVIFKGDTGVNGVTTAATIWVVAALGMGIGAGYEGLAIAGCILLLPILIALNFVSRWLERLNEMHVYKIACTYQPGIVESFLSHFKTYRLRPGPGVFRRDSNEFSATWTVHGHANNHQKFINEILNDPSIKSFQF